MAYRRQSRYPFSSYGDKTKVSITWDSLSNAGYNCKFDNVRGANWDKFQAVLTWIKVTVPSSQREYDPETKVWLVGEAYINDLKKLVAGLNFDVVFAEKPQAVATATQYNTANDYQRFKQLIKLAGIVYDEASLDDSLDISLAKKIYRKAAMKFHPDVNPSMYEQMSELNILYSRLEELYFKKELNNV